MLYIDRLRISIQQFFPSPFIPIDFIFLLVSFYSDRKEGNAQLFLHFLNVWRDFSRRNFSFTRNKKVCYVKNKFNDLINPYQTYDSNNLFNDTIKIPLSFFLLLLESNWLPRIQIRLTFFPRIFAVFSIVPISETNLDQEVNVISKWNSSVVLAMIIKFAWIGKREGERRFNPVIIASSIFLIFSFTSYVRDRERF